MKTLLFVTGFYCLMNIVNAVHPVDQKLVEIEQILEDVVSDIAAFNLQSACLLDRVFDCLQVSPHSHTRVLLKNRLLRILNNNYSTHSLDNSGPARLTLNQLALLVAIKEQIKQRDLDNEFYINQGYRKDFRIIKKFLSEEECSTIGFIEHS